MANDNASAHPASQYDAEVRKVIPFYDAIQAETLDVVKITRRGNVKCWLDTGCGTGSLVERALGVFSRTKFLLADPSPAMLAVASERLRGNPHVRFLDPVSSEGLPGQVVPGSMDVVTAMLCHHYLNTEGRIAALKGCYDVLAPGGLLIVFENTDAESLLGREQGLARWRTFQLEQGRSAEDVDRHLARFGTELKPIPVTAHLKVLAAAGFGVVELFWRAHQQAGFYAIK